MFGNIKERMMKKELFFTAMGVGVGYAASYVFFRLKLKKVLDNHEEEYKEIRELYSSKLEEYKDEIETDLDEIEDLQPTTPETAAMVVKVREKIQRPEKRELDSEEVTKEEPYLDEDLNERAKEEKAAIMQDYAKYSELYKGDETMNVETERPYFNVEVVDEDDYALHQYDDEWGNECLVYFEDNILAFDETGNVISDEAAYEAMGQDIRNSLENEFETSDNEDPDIIYIRNNMKQKQFKIVREYETYQDALDEGRYK